MSHAQQEPRQQFLGLAFDCLDEAGAVERITQLAAAPSFSFVVTPNVDHLVRLHREQAGGPLWSAYRAAALCLCDSRVLRRLASWSGIGLPLVTGSDLTATLLRGDWLSARRLAVVGGDENLGAALGRLLPEARLAQHVPPLGVRGDPMAQQEIVRFVEEQRADLVLFAIGAPQSELLCGRIVERGRARGVGLCIGASLEFVTGAKRRAPRWMRRIGAEWLFRLLSEPGRLWRRYLVEGPRIFRIWRRWHAERRALSPRGPAGSGSSQPGGKRHR